ncbi:MAG: hypothetical protein D6702_12040 [Planctomycetota bacterium]|nr:MAG: hypothetical protein D6702_12040 [Planctomycetota bacterium]
MNLRRLPAALVPALPFLAALFVPAATPARALALAWILEAGVGARAGAEAARWSGAGAALRWGSCWALLHFLRPDAGPAAGVVLILLIAVAGRFWRRPAPGAGLLPLLLLGPAAVAALLALGGRQPPELLARLDGWRRLGPPVAAGEVAEPRVSLPTGAEVCRLPFRPPERLVPWPLQDSPARPRALLLAAAALLLAAAGGAAGRPRAALALPVLAAAAAWWAAPPERLEVRFQLPDGRAYRLEARAGDGVWDPLSGALLPPAGRWSVRPRADGLLALRAGGPWAVAAPGPAAAAGGEVALAQLEFSPLRAPRGEGDPAALALLRWWAAGERPGAAVRWRLLASGLLVREPL